MPPKKKVAANGYKFAEPLPKDTILEDIGKKRWRLGPSIGKGGFGEIYSAKEETDKNTKYPYVVKIEPHSNGPLFVEINFYIRNAKPVDINAYKQENGLKTFGMPFYYGSGSYDYKKEKYRFLVMDKFASDLYQIYINNNKIFPTDTVFKIGLQLLDVLQYIHQRGYVHADIKAANILMGTTKETQNKQVYLVDFGLATKYTLEKEFKPNPKKAHDGTIEFLSRDAHQGVQTRRGDLEILAYNLLQWLGCELPWEKNLSDPKVVQNSKEENMSSVPKMIKACFGTKPHPKAITDYLNYLKTLKFNTEPDYDKIRTIFKSGIKEGGGSIGTILQFSIDKTPKRTRTPLTNIKSSNKVKSSNEHLEEADEDKTTKPRKRGRPKKTVQENDGDVTPNLTPKPEKRVRKNVLYTEDDEDVTEKPREKGRRKKPAQDKFDEPKPSTSGRNQRIAKAVQHHQDIVTNASGDDSESSNSNTPDFITRRKVTKTTNKGQLNRKVSMSLNDLSKPNDDPFEGYTDAMKEIAKKKINKPTTQKRKPGAKAKLTRANSITDLRVEDNMAGYTAEMKEIAIKKQTKVKRTKHGTAS